MKLRLARSHHSIKTFPDIELPAFSLITGLNGSGKTHLLRAVEAGDIEVKGIPKEQIRFCTWSDLAPADASAFSSHVLGEERQNLYNSFEARRNKIAENLLSLARSVGLPGHVLSRVENVAAMSVDELAKYGVRPTVSTPEADAAVAVRRQLDEVVKSISNEVLSRVGDVHQQTELQLIADRVRKPIAALGETDFSLSSTPNWGRTSIFQQDFGRLFVQYMELVKANKLKRQAAKEGVPDTPYLTEEEFRQKYLPPPWEFVNQAFKDAGLGFTINHPDPYETRPFLPKVTKISNGAEVAFSALSSGERIIMSLAVVLYQALDRRQFSQYPRILLLDEVDGPLHPSMSRHLVRTITATLVERHKIEVMATTHSPSTVAVAPENALYCMVAEVPGLKKIGRAQALNILTDGVPTLSISHDGRRQVFVESGTDASRYSDLFQLLKAALGSGRSLDFIATGSQDKLRGAERNTGREAVRRIVKALVDCGNQSVFGLTDWDAEASAEGRVLVLAEGTRYAIENVLLDPLLLLGLLFKHPRGPEVIKSKLPAADGVSYAEYLVMTPAQLQSFVDPLQSFILGSERGATETALYQGGFGLVIRTEYLRMNGHDLEDLIVGKFPELRVHGNTGRAVLAAVIKNVVRDKIDYLPREVSHAFLSILEAPVHISRSDGNLAA
jgi:energy-coupling factor transporter ATP-binding protein EcfA2